LLLWVCRCCGGVVVFVVVSSFYAHWHGVRCDEGLEHVVGLDLVGNNLK